MKKYKLLLAAFKKSISWFILIALEIINFVMEKFLLQKDSQLFTITSLIILYFTITEVRENYKELKNEYEKQQQS